ncbi:hypothetical protein BD626DRAFT_579322 [Schizophyllum amplum]|nr:hypothetical protein BD626DRAFT_579322 [Auriculariopsis ampla]
MTPSAKKVLSDNSERDAQDSDAEDSVPVVKPSGRKEPHTKSVAPRSKASSGKDTKSPASSERRSVPPKISHSARSVTPVQASDEGGSPPPVISPEKPTGDIRSATKKSNAKRIVKRSDVTKFYDDEAEEEDDGEGEDNSSYEFFPV